MNNILRLFAALILCGICFVFACADHDSKDNLTTDTETPIVNDDDDDDDDDLVTGPCTIEVTAAIDLAGGLLELSDGASLFISPGAIEEETVIGFGTTTAVELADGMDVVSTIYCAEPFSTVLAAPSILTYDTGSNTNALFMPLPRIYTGTSFAGGQPEPDSYYGLAVTLFPERSTASVHIDQLSWYFEAETDPPIEDVLVSPFGGWVPGTAEHSQFYINETDEVAIARSFFIARLAEADDEAENYTTPPSRAIGSVFKIYVSSMQPSYQIQLSLPSNGVESTTIYQYDENNGNWYDLHAKYTDINYNDSNISVARTDGQGYFVVVDQTSAN